MMYITDMCYSIEGLEREREREGVIKNAGGRRTERRREGGRIHKELKQSGGRIGKEGGKGGNMDTAGNTSHCCVSVQNPNPPHQGPHFTILHTTLDQRRERGQARAQ